MDFAQRLRELMEDKGITAYRLAKKLNVHQTTVKNWLEGNSRPRAGYMEELADYFEVSIDYLMGYNDDPNYMLQSRLDLREPSIKKQASSSAKYESIEEQVSQLNILIKYDPDEILSSLSKLCRNERIEQDLTERYIAKAANISLDSYLLFESGNNNLSSDQIISVLTALNLNVFSTLNILRGIVAAFLKKNNQDPKEFINEIEDDEIIIEASELLYSMDSDTLRYALSELKRLCPELENKNDFTDKKVQKAYFEALKNRPQQ